jgi:hypothetical protein
LNMLDIEEKNLALLTKNGSTDHGTVLTTMLSIKLRHNNRNLLSLLNTTAAAYELEFLQKAKSVNELKGLNEEHKESSSNGDMKSLSSLLSIKCRIIDRMASDGFTVDGKSKKSLSMNRNRKPRERERE